MNRKQTDKLMNTLLSVAAGLVLVGAFFKLQHYPYGNSILVVGLIAFFALQSYEINRLKKIIKQQDDKNQE